MPLTNEKYSTDEFSFKKGPLGKQLSLELLLYTEMSIRANSTIRNSKKID